MVTPTAVRAATNGHAPELGAVVPVGPITVDTFRIGDVRPNPFRDIGNYPLLPDKIDALRASFRNTSVWPTIVARMTDGRPEIAFGHHRLEAARQEFGDDGRIPLNIADLNDESMLKMMANENMAEYQTDASVQMETVRQVVLAYADGRIGLSPPVGPQYLRYAPFFGMLSTFSTSPYNPSTISDFLGWDNEGGRVRDALGMLEEIERGTFEATDFQGMNQHQAVHAIRGVREAEREAQAHGLDPEPIRKAAAAAAVQDGPNASASTIRQAARQAAQQIINPPRVPVFTGSTPEEQAAADVAMAVVDSEVWMMPLEAAVDEMREALKWAESEDFSSRQPDHIAMLRLELEEAADIVRQIERKVNS